MSTPYKVFQKWLASLLLGIITLTGVLPVNVWASEPSERTAESIEVIQSLPEADDPAERGSTEIIADEEILPVVHSVADEALIPTGENEVTAPETKEAKEKTLGKEQESQAPPTVEAEDEEEPALEISDPFMSIQVLRASGYNVNSKGNYSFTDQRGQRYECPYITVNGDVVYCLENKKNFPINESYKRQLYTNEGIYNIVYYAHQWGWDKPGANYVRTHIALNIQAGNMAYHVQDAGVDKLLQKAKDKTAPFGKLSISSPNQTATIGKTKRQVTDWYKVSGVKNTTLSFSLPSGVTLHTRDGKTQTGKITLKGSQDFWLSAPLDKTVTVNATVKPNTTIYPMFLFIPPRKELQQVVQYSQSSDPQNTVKISAKFFKRTGDLEGNKKDIETGQPLEGAVFVLKDGAKTIARATTDRNGKFVFKDIPMGDYTLHEIKAPKNYRPVKSPKSITITPQQTTTVTITNEPMKAKIHITKVDDRDYQNEGVKPPLAGIVFEVLDPMGRLIQTLTTDKQGHAESDWLRLDTYTLKERTPAGYYPMTTITQGLTQDRWTYYLNVENQPIRQRLQVVKVDAESGETITMDHAHFKIYDRQTQRFVIMEKPNTLEKTDIFVTNENGYFITPTTLEYGVDRYELREIKAPEGYVLPRIATVFSIDSPTDKIKIINFSNRQARANIRLFKYDRAQHVHKRTGIAGVTFDLYRTYKGVTEKVGTYTTNAAGVLTVEKLPIGDYAFHEMRMPEGYKRLEKPVNFRIMVPDDGKVIVLDAENERQPIELQTTATVGDNEKVFNPIDEIPVKDEISFTHLIPGKEYVFKAQIIETGHPDRVIKTLESRFTPDTMNGTHTIETTLTPDQVRGKSITWLETLVDGEDESYVWAEHHDPNDESQTVRITDPNVGTQATDVTGKFQAFDPLEKVTQYTLCSS